MKICVGVMVKDECDIVREWILYYGSIFGFENLYIIDNYSTDGTYEICLEFQKKGIKLRREKDYKLKGNFMTQFKNTLKYDFFLPIDIDEFIVLYDNEIKEPTSIIDYFKELKNKKKNQIIFKMNYINPLRTNNQDYIFNQFTHGNISNYNQYAKSFLQNIKNNICIDHGNHIPDKDYFMSNLYLVHYHQRTNEQFKKKITNNVSGLGYKLDKSYLKNEIKKNKDCPGNHHVKNVIKMCEEPNKSFTPTIANLNNLKDSINLEKLINFIRKLKLYKKIEIIS